MTHRTIPSIAGPVNFPLQVDRTEQPLSRKGRRPKASRGLIPGDCCPRCGKEKLDYDGLLNLSCRNCGFSSSGACT